MAIATPPVIGRRLVVTGASGLIGFPLCRELANQNEVFALARFRSERDAAELRSVGAVPIVYDAYSDDLSALPDKIDIVVHLAARTPVREARSLDDQRLSIDANSLGTGRLLSRYRDAGSFVFASTSSVYIPQDHPMVESDPLGVTEHHMNGYVLSKIIGESVVTMLSTEFGTPAVIVRIAQMYGPRGGAPTARIDRVKRGEPVPVFGTNPNEASIMFEDDYVEKLIASTGIASIPPVVLNFAGTQTTIQEYCTIAAELLGIEATFVTSPEATRPLPVDLTKMRSYLGRTRTPLKNAIARTIEASEAERGTGWGTLWLPGD